MATMITAYLYVQYSFLQFEEYISTSQTLEPQPPGIHRKLHTMDRKHLPHCPGKRNNSEFQGEKTFRFFSKHNKEFNFKKFQFIPFTIDMNMNMS